MVSLPNPLAQSTTIRSTTMQMCQTLQSESAAVGRPEWGLMFTTKVSSKLLWYIRETMQLESSDWSIMTWPLHSLRSSVSSQVFHNVRSYQVTFIWPVCGNVESKWTCQCFDSKNSSIWIEEDSGNDKLNEVETKKLKKKGSDSDRGADGKRHKGEDSEGYIRTDNFVWTDDETEQVLKQQPESSTGSQVSVNMLTFGAQYCTMNVEEGKW